MIWLIASLIAGIAFRAWAVILLVVAYLASRKSRDSALLIYFFYGILLVSEVHVGDFISYESLKALAIIVPSIAILREILSGTELKVKFTPLQLIGIFVLAAGLLYGYLLPWGTALLIAGEEGLSFRALRDVAAGVLVLFSMLWIVKAKYPYLYTPENQVAIAAGFIILLILKEIRNLKKVEFKLRMKS
ncbi:hypothetical protein [Thermococcus barophilus]|uniref:Uncharacterized protein n=1 Tax=Thermococcus barophilus (strain DSM 11836 / MP) TaxID=391623 RepID=F0LLX6_THEBM|nr:hypothetical protein [Thermococcus barophilus]ADT85075.1 hypothetical protein TERMP_02101 [Thermococcus barophilus MP]